MKYREIKLEDNKSVLVDESAEIINLDYYLYNGKEIRQEMNSSTAHMRKFASNKIITTINHSISLDVPMVIVEDEVEKLAMEIITNMGLDWYETETSARGVARFCASQQKGGYSEADVRNAFKAGDCYGKQVSTKGNINDYIQSLKQEYIDLEMFDVECSCKSKEDMSKCSINCCKSNSRNFPRIKTNRDTNGQLMAYKIKPNK